MTEKMTRPRGRKSRPTGPCPVGTVSNAFITQFCSAIVARIIHGHSELSGDEFGKVFADLVNGRSMSKTRGVGDVSLDRTCWSVKTVKLRAPLRAKRVRLISGRNSPSFSHGIEDPFKDVRKTGDAVLSVWNDRVDEAWEQFPDCRVIVLVRNMEKLEFTIFEEELTRFPPKDFTWTRNANGNFEGREKNSGRHMFTWQPHGSQFTIICQVPDSSRKFRINQRVGKETIEEIHRIVEEKVDFEIVWFNKD